MTTFEKQCREVYDKTGVSVFFCYNEKGTDCHEDDGCLHIRKSGLRACFDVSPGQNLSGADQNKNTRAVMEALGMASKIDDRVLVDETEDDDDDDYCESCGRHH